MKDLYEIYEEIAANPDRWSYYTDPEYDLLQALHNDYEAAAFIGYYIELAGKECLIEQNLLRDLLNVKRENRVRHIVSTFILSLYFAEKLDLNAALHEHDGFNYKYHLLLMCLYHDMGYVYEEKSDSSDLLSKIETDGISALKSELNFRCDLRPVFQTYSMDIVDIYLRGRAREYLCVDHGISGGIMLYSFLRKQFEKSWCRKIKGDSRDSFYCLTPNRRERHLSRSHFKEYAVVADAIIAHNIYISTLNEYLENRKHSTIDYKIDYRERPLLFILALADTLEPLKKGIDLRQVEIESTTDGFSIVLDDKADLVLKDNIIGICDWMACDVTVLSESGLHQYIIRISL